MKNALGLLASLLVLVCIVALVRSMQEAPLAQGVTDAVGAVVRVAPSGLVGATMSAAFLLLGAWLTGELMARIRLPRVSGYLIFGIAVGPNLAAMLPEGTPPLIPAEQMEYLDLVDALAISMIALIAGGEIRISFVRSILRRILTLLGADFVFIFLGICGAVLLLRSFLPFLADVSGTPLLILALLIATFALANSPAIVIAMVKETGANGPMARTAVALTIFKDLCLVILFSALLATASAMLSSPDTVADVAGEATTAAHEHSLTFEIAWHLLGSIVFGGLVGLIMQAIGRRMGNRMDLFIVAAGFGIAVLSDALELAPLLVALAAGFVQANLWPRSSEAFFHAIEELSLPVYCLFFAVTGARIHVDALVQLWPVALVFVGLRLMLTFSAVTLGSWLAGFSREGRWLWTALIPQAGVSIALVMEIGRTFSDQPWGEQLRSLLLAVVAMHELIGPPLMRLGLSRSGELRN